ncbi:MAG: DUF4421 domain-containing protein [Bacteroidota bacterium]
MKRLLLSFVVLTGFSSLPAQTIATHPDRKELRDSTYIQELNDKFYLRPLLTNRSISLDIEDQADRVSDILYEPTFNNYLGLGLYAFDVGVELSFRLRNNSQDPEIYGETDAFDFQANLYMKKWGADINFQRYSGFYLERPEDHYATWRSGDAFPQRDDLALNNLQLNAFYIFNHKRFSYRSAYNQADIQLKSAGSFLLGFTVSTFRFSGDSTLVPTQTQSDLPAELNISSGRFTALGILPGYTHNFICKQFYLNLSFSAGPAHLWSRYSTERKETNDLNIRPILNVRAALGYNSDSFFGGLSLVNQGVSYEISELDVNAVAGNVKLFVGYRFNERGFLTKQLF